MKLISHRGNIDGKIEANENCPDYILSALDSGYDVEIDVRKIKNEWYLGHDYPQYVINRKFLNIPNLWIHTKNGDAFYELLKYKKLNVFWHNTDDFILTSKKFIWTFPNKQLYKNSICVLPEKGYTGNIKKCHGICSDFIKKYKNL